MAESKDASYRFGDHFLAHRIRNSDILSWVRNSNLTHIILPRLSLEDCSLVVLELPHMVPKEGQCLVKAVTYIRVTGHLIFQPYRYAVACVK